MFTSGVQLGDLNDFIEASQECVVPLFEEKPEQEVLKREIRPDLIKSDPQGPARVRLNDCLACSGCVTTAEVVLLEAQSAKLVADIVRAQVDCRRALRSGRFVEASVLVTVFGLATHSLCALAKFFSLEPMVFLARLCDALPDGCYVVDFTPCEALALLEESRATKEKAVSSHCPGLVCIMEKTGDPADLDFLSTSPSAQAIFGRVVHEVVRRDLRSAHFSGVFHRPMLGAALARAMSHLLPSQIHVVSVQPCYDKKLEALRPEYYVEGQPEVSCVLGANELLEVLHQLHLIEPAADNSWKFKVEPRRGIFKRKPPSPKSVVSQPNYIHWGKCQTKVPVFVPNHFASGGFAEYVALSESTSVHSVQGKNSDLWELAWAGRHEDGKLTSKTGIVGYGLRNINTLLRKLTTTSATYLEIMACPRGCVNGGAHGLLLKGLEHPLDCMNSVVLTTARQHADPLCAELTRRSVHLPRLEPRAVKPPENVITHSDLKW
ncbi:MAG: hypothetical protein KVP17_004065 [Porospora cf. gigantea B]|uniref:uncharacterized protein n=1 Tax=Porospora cf. gigantea B TaxID=2853592 RepID=UPI003571EBEE|nr:MAG: hypothetical protein KVP17_004065 [Porospora cf. gigantea B]